MTSMFRSEELAYCQILFPMDAVYECVGQIGILELFQFDDLNEDANSKASPTNKFTAEIQRCHEMEKQITFLKGHLLDEELPIADDLSPNYTQKQWFQIPKASEIAEIEVALSELENELNEFDRLALKLKQEIMQKIEKKCVIKKCEKLFTNPDSSKKSFKGEDIWQSIEKSDLIDSKIYLTTGVINHEKLMALEIMIWRISHGNAIFHHFVIESPFIDPIKRISEYKIVFMIVALGFNLHEKIEKICISFKANIHQIPENKIDQNKLSEKLSSEIYELNTVLKINIEHTRRILHAASKEIYFWHRKINAMKSIYFVMNKFSADMTSKCLVAEGWTPLLDIQKIRFALQVGTEQSGMPTSAIIIQIDTEKTPPTLNRTNKFIAGFQALTDAYGVATYREINPAPYLIVTFPFLFAMMFGDFGHGFLLSLFGLWLVLKEEKLNAAIPSNNEILRLVFAGRYIILMMGFFSMYTGLIYNDCFSKSIQWFQGSWKNPYNSSTIMSNNYLQFDPKTTYAGVPYSFGIDPVWQVAPLNSIIFLNAFKMKISIIFGVVHMIFGLVLSVYNHRFFGQDVLIIAEFIPQLIFLGFLFAYLVTLIFLKWIWYSAAEKTVRLSAGCAPSVLITFINMMLVKKPKILDADSECSPYMFPYQHELQCFLLFVAFSMVPCMLFLKPFLMRHKLQNVDKAEMFIHQGITTIEFVLGSVSHTASYLRLWALSLAHAQLSEVLWTMVMKNGFAGATFWGGITLVFAFGFWAILTIAILILMEGLSAFLHTLRLHWVEFQSKFYKGAGHSFQPFSFEKPIK